VLPHSLSGGEPPQRHCQALHASIAALEGNAHAKGTVVQEGTRHDGLRAQAIEGKG
jgi:hypothetical protein